MRTFWECGSSAFFASWLQRSRAADSVFRLTGLATYSSMPNTPSRSVSDEFAALDELHWETFDIF